MDPPTGQAGTGAQPHREPLAPIALIRGELHQANSGGNYGPRVTKGVSGPQTDTPQEQGAESWKEQEAERQIVLCTQQPQLPPAERPAASRIQQALPGAALSIPRGRHGRARGTGAGAARRNGCSAPAEGTVLAVSVPWAGGERTPAGHPFQAGPSEEVTGCIFNSKVQIIFFLLFSFFFFFCLPSSTDPFLSQQPLAKFNRLKKKEKGKKFVFLFQK